MEIKGSEYSRELAKLCVRVTMAQRGNHLGTLDFEEIAARCDCATVDVPTSAVGFVMGSKGATLRELESRHNAFLVFDNDTVRDDAKRMYVLGGAENRDRVIAETLEAVDARNLASAEKRYLAPWSEVRDAQARGEPPPSGKPVVHWAAGATSLHALQPSWFLVRDCST